MGKRGKQSKDELTTPPPEPVQKAPEPPDDFTEAQRDLWKVLIHEHGIFRQDLWNLVEAYVRSSTSIRRIGKLINDLEARDELDQKQYESALRMRERESRLVASLAIRLGIAKGTDKNGSPLRPEAQPTGNPWE